MTTPEVPATASLRGTRVELQSPGPDDVDCFLAATRRSRALHRPWVHPPTTVEAYHHWLLDLADGRRERWLVRRRGAEALVGYVAANEIAHGPLQSAYLGYWGVLGDTGRGIMKDALSVAIQHWFGRRRLRLHRLEANIQPQNEASRGLVESLGFRLEGMSPRYLKVGGRWRDHERWAITVEDWRTGRATPPTRPTRPA